VKHLSNKPNKQSSLYLESSGERNLFKLNLRLSFFRQYKASPLAKLNF